MSTKLQQTNSLKSTSKRKTEISGVSSDNNSNKTETKKLYRRPKTSLFSLNQNLVDEVENDESESDEIDPSLPQDKFHAQDFEKFWINYKSKIRNTNTPLFNVLDTVIWRIDNQMNVHLLFDSGTMEIEFDRVKEDFVRSARKSLNNYALRVISDVSKDVTTVSHIKSRRNIYDELVEKYPIVDKFTRSLGLDIENEPD